MRSEEQLSWNNSRSLVNFEKTGLETICPSFVSLLLSQFTRYQHFLWVRWFPYWKVPTFGWWINKINNPWDNTGHVKQVLWQKTILFRDFLLLLAKNTKNEKQVIFHGNGKSGSWISHMLYPIHSTKWWDQKKLKKTYCRMTFWFGRKMGRMGCRPWRRAKSKNVFLSSSWQSCG